MKNQWMLFLTGYVRIRVRGKGVERFFNELLRQQVQIWNVKRIGEEVVECNIQAKDIPILRRVRKHYECSFSFVGKRGVPFRMKKAWFYNGFIIGVLGFILVMFLLSNMVWNIEIKGANPETEELIKQELKELGVKRGAFLFQLDDPETIQQKLTNSISAITWIGVQLNGTTYDFQVVEKEEPEPEEKLSPQNLVATKEAIITKIYVENGKAAVRANDYVKKGQVLISGSIGKEDSDHMVLVPATGVVIGETWYESDVEVPLTTELQVYTGESQKEYFLNIGSLQIKIWGFTKNTYKHQREESEEKAFRFLKWTLPITYKEVTVREIENKERKYTMDEAVQVGKENGQKELKQKLEKNAMIKEEKVLHQTVEDGKVKLRIYFVVEESIAVEQPILLGDRK